MSQPAQSIESTRPLPRTRDEDRYFDYCLQPYEPIRDPRGKLRSECLLWNSLDVAAAPSALDDALHAVQRAAGRDMTVFGVKHHQGKLWWELYFYDTNRDLGAVRAESIVDALEPWCSFSARPRESIPYFMFSFDVFADTANAGNVEVVNLYLPYYEVQGGRSYKLSANGMEMDNVYRFLHPKTEIREILHEIHQSVYVDYERIALSQVLLPELIDCNRICVAKKRFADAIYYSGLDVGQLIFFLRRFDYPEDVRSFVESNRSELDHLRFDVGIDYRMEPDGSLGMAKSGYYGTL